MAAGPVQVTSPDKKKIVAAMSTILDELPLISNVYKPFANAVAGKTLPANTVLMHLMLRVKAYVDSLDRALKLAVGPDIYDAIPDYLNAIFADDKAARDAMRAAYNAVK